MRFHRSPESGYVMMVLILMMALILVSLTAVAPAIKQQLQRDREEEMIHRGAQYARAIKRYFKKFGRYPTSIDQLENTNNLRFLRRQYKDPMTPDGKWGLLHVGDVKLGTGATVGVPVSALASPTGALGQPTSGAFGQPITGGLGQATPGALGQTTTAGALGQSPGTPTAQPGGQLIGESAPAAGQPTSASGSTGSPSKTGTSGAFGAGAIIGVVSASDQKGLHEFNDKSQYNQWYFVYDPTIDRGGLITGPFTGKTFSFPGAAGVANPAGVPGASPAGQSTFGQPAQPSSFGQPAGQPSTFGQPGGMSQPAPTPQTPSQPPQ
jgi:type II secretory pathway pseudopilin PulG